MLKMLKKQKARKSIRSKTTRNKSRNTNQQNYSLQLIGLICRTIVLLIALVIAKSALESPTGNTQQLWIFLEIVAGCATLTKVKLFR